MTQEELKIGKLYRIDFCEEYADCPIVIFETSFNSVAHADDVGELDDGETFLLLDLAYREYESLAQDNGPTKSIETNLKILGPNGKIGWVHHYKGDTLKCLEKEDD